MASSIPPKEIMLLEAAPVAWGGLVAEAERLAEREPEAAELGLTAPVEPGAVELTPGTMGVTRVGTGAMGVAEPAGGVTGRLLVSYRED